MSQNEDTHDVEGLAPTGPVTPLGEQYEYFGGDQYTAADADAQLILLDAAVAHPAAERDTGWRTISGVHVHMDADGKIDKGPAALKGKTHAEAHAHVAKRGHDAKDEHVVAEKAHKDRKAGVSPIHIPMSVSKVNATLGSDHPLRTGHATPELEHEKPVKARAKATAAKHPFSPHAKTDDLKKIETVWNEQASRMTTSKLKTSLRDHDQNISNPNHPVAKIAEHVMRRELESRGVKINDQREATASSPAKASPAPHGWKLHVGAEPQHHDAVEKHLQAIGLPYKKGHNGGQAGKDFTVYAGSRDKAQAAAASIHETVGHLLNEPSAEVKNDDAQLAGHVHGRFDIGAKDKKFHEYGSGGVPYTADDMHNRAFGNADGSEFDHAAAKAKAHAILAKRYGSFYTGSPAAVSHVVTPQGPEAIAALPKHLTQYIGSETREQSLNRYRIARGLGLDVAAPKHGSEQGYLGDADQKRFEHFLDSEYEAKHGKLDEHDHVAMKDAGYSLGYAEHPDVVGGLIFHATNEKADEGAAKKIATHASVERQLIEHHEAIGGDAENAGAHSDEESDEHGEYGSVASLRNRTFHKALPTEVKQHLKGRGGLLRHYRVTDDASKAGGHDTMETLGEDKYLQAVEQFGMSKTNRALQSAKQSGDPGLQFLAAVHERTPQLTTSESRRSINRNKRRMGLPVERQQEAAAKQWHFPTDALETGHSFTIHGEHFHVDEPEEGQRVLLGPSHYPEMPLDALSHIPIDKDSLYRRKETAHMPQAHHDEADADLPFSAAAAYTDFDVDDRLIELSQGSLFGGFTEVSSDQGRLFEHGKPTAAATGKGGGEAKPKSSNAAGDGHWVTIHGAHILIKQGQSISKALNDHFKGSKEVRGEHVYSARKQIHAQGGKIAYHHDDHVAVAAGDYTAKAQVKMFLDSHRSKHMLTDSGRQAIVQDIAHMGEQARDALKVAYSGTRQYAARDHVLATLAAKPAYVEREKPKTAAEDDDENPFGGGSTPAVKPTAKPAEPYTANDVVAEKLAESPQEIARKAAVAAVRSPGRDDDDRPGAQTPAVADPTPAVAAVIQQPATPVKKVFSLEKQNQIIGAHAITKKQGDHGIAEALIGGPANAAAFDQHIADGRTHEQAVALAKGWTDHPSLDGIDTKPAAAKPVASPAAESPAATPTVVDPTRQLGLNAKDASGAPAEVGEAVGQANLFNNLGGKPKAAASYTPKDVDAALRAKFDENATTPMFDSVPAAATPAERVGRAAADGVVKDFGEFMPGARKHTAKPTGPKVKVEKAVDDRPTWRKRYDVVEDANKPGQHFVVDKKTKTPLKDPQAYWQVKNHHSIESAEQAIVDHEARRVLRTYGARKPDGTPEHGVYFKNSAGKLAKIVGGFDSDEAAQQHLKTNTVELLNHKFEDPKRPYLQEVNRTGPAHRESIAKEGDFQKTFNFRGGQFGNWQTNKDGQTSLNHAYDALHDLAGVTGIKREHLSFNGKLGMAFGARGTGGKDSAAAHYEPDTKIINLTKMNGAGSLAHEYWHALDNHLGEKFAGEGSYATESHSGHTHGRQSKLPADLDGALAELHNAMHHKHVIVPADAVGATQRLAQSRKNVTDRLARIEQHHNDIIRWNQQSPQRGVIARAFTPDEQKQWDEHKDAILAGNAGEKKWIPTTRPGRNGTAASGRHTTERQEAMNDLFKKATGSNFHKSTGSSQGDYLHADVSNHLLRLKDHAAAIAGEGTPKKMQTDFKRNSDDADAHRVEPYFGTHKEMAARAFESYVEDKVKGQGHSSDYLVHGTQRGQYSQFMPKGAERQKINEAFDKVLAAARPHVTSAGTTTQTAATTPARSTVPLSTIVDQVNAKHGEGLTEADRVPDHLQSRASAAKHLLNLSAIQDEACAAVVTTPIDEQPVLLSCSYENPDLLFLSAACSTRDAVTMGQGLPTHHNKLQIHYEWHDAAVAGNWIHPKKGTPVPIDRKRIDRWVKNIDLSNARRVALPACKDHKENADNSIGEIYGAKRNGDRLSLLIGYYGDDAYKTGQRNKLSIGIDRDFKDAYGNKYGEAIRHVAITPVPVIPGQHGFIDG